MTAVRAARSLSRTSISIVTLARNHVHRPGRDVEHADGPDGPAARRLRGPGAPLRARPRWPRSARRAGRSIGVDPACRRQAGDGDPQVVRSRDLFDRAEGMPSRSSTVPCSMWSSTARAIVSGSISASARLSGSRPQERIASATATPDRSASASRSPAARSSRPSPGCRCSPRRTSAPPPRTRLSRWGHVGAEAALAGAPATASIAPSTPSTPS